MKIAKISMITALTFSMLTSFNVTSFASNEPIELPSQSSMVLPPLQPSDKGIETAANPAGSKTYSNLAYGQSVVYDWAYTVLVGNVTLNLQIEQKAVDRSKSPVMKYELIGNGGKIVKTYYVNGEWGFDFVGGTYDTHYGTVASNAPYKLRITNLGAFPINGIVRVSYDIS